MAIEFDTREYQFSHGKTPRGRGSWAFFFDDKTDVSDAFWTPGSTTYAEAKKLARAEALRRGHWRHYPNHKTWINWMLVGDPDLGFVDKHYKL